MKKVNSIRYFGTAFTITALAAFMVMCAGGLRAAAADTPSEPAVKFWEAGSTVAWNRRYIALFRAKGGNPGRTLAYLSLAQYRAVLAARDDHGPRRPSLAGAAAGASVAVLTFFNPADAATFETEIGAQRAAPGWPGEQQSDFAAGEAIGRMVGAAVIALAQADNFGATPPGAPPVGPQYWYSNGAPTVRGNYGARTFHLTHDGELLWAPPPAFGSAEYLAGLAEVRAISDARTPEQDAIARKWVPFSGVVFNGIATSLIVKHHRSELDAARILAYANTAAFDAIAGCFYTKFHYWFVRPSQADAAIKFPAGLGLPNHPSYPSAHSCESGAFQGVLSDAFPGESEALAALAAEANNSRIYAGFHYRFDGNAGLELGRAAARIALERKSLEPPVNTAGSPASLGTAKSRSKARVTGPRAHGSARSHQ